MKKLIILLISLVASVGISNACIKKKWYEKNDPRIEIVNEGTIILKDVVRIEIHTNHKDQITYVYDLKHSRLVKVARGTFDVDLPRGNYLVQSNKKITKTVYEIIVE